MATTKAPAQHVPAPAPEGLSSAEAAARLARDGPNVLPPPPKLPAWRQLAAQMVHFFALLLWAAGGLAIVAGMPQLGVAIFVVVVLNGVFAFLQEHRAEQAAERLRDLLPRRAMVVRDGHPREVDAASVVAGDVVLLAAGDAVPADLRLVETHALAVDTSTLTGESVPARPGAGEPLLSGCFVTEGEGVAVVEATGARTRLAGIAALTHAAVRPPTPLARELHRVVRLTAGIAIGVGLAFFVLALLIGTPASDGLMFAIGVTVALVPEGLLPTVTLSLAMGAQRMARRNALVRRLEAVETLGSTTFICTDKTGTLTQNRMSIVEVWTPAGVAHIRGAGYEPSGEVDAPGDVVPALRTIAAAARRCSNGRVVERDGEWVASGDTMEAAIDAFARRVHAVDGDDGGDDVEARFPFDPRRRRMSVVAGGQLLVKGAPDAVLPRCAPDPVAAAATADMAARGLRVLAVAARPWGGGHEPRDADDVERGLSLLGLLGFEDPPRPAAAAAVADCRRAGIRLAMVTGDHPATARAIAEEVGLLAPGGLVLEGASLPDDDAVLGALVDRDGVVVSRVSPEDKLRIARALRARGHVVAMTGDGVNDGPALQASDIGVAMGRSGTDVAREAADLVLLDDDFATVVAAVSEGRATFSNVRRFLTYHLTDNVAELTPFAVWALSGGRFPLAIGVLQVLCLDIGTDILPALALGAEPAHPKLLDRPPVRGRLMDRSVLTRVFGVAGPAEALFEMLAFLTGLVAAGWRPGGAFPAGHALYAASGAAFSAVVLGQAANAYACRSSSMPVWASRRDGNRMLGWAVLTEVAMLAAFLFVGPVARLLRHAPPPWPALLVALLAPVAVMLADARYKVRVRRARGAVRP